jgi:ATP/maltotriose-dependent transcriptional regulator MalT
MEGIEAMANATFSARLSVLEARALLVKFALLQGDAEAAGKYLEELYDEIIEGLTYYDERVN